VRKDPPQHLASLAGVADAKNDVFAAVWLWARAQDDRLYVARFDLYVARCDYGNLDCGCGHEPAPVLRLVKQSLTAVSLVAPSLTL
jgi:hypothetical protein